VDNDRLTGGLAYSLAGLIQWLLSGSDPELPDSGEQKGNQGADQWAWGDLPQGLCD